MKTKNQDRTPVKMAQIALKRVQDYSWKLYDVECTIGSEIGSLLENQQFLELKTEKARDRVVESSLSELKSRKKLYESLKRVEFEIAALSVAQMQIEGR